MGFFSLVVACIDLLAWPFLAFGYPLCASVHAIETDSASDTRNLMSYWIFLSLIYLVEQAFAHVLQWLQVWIYIKLLIVFCLAIPRFEGAYHAYNRLIRPYISTDVRSLTIWLKSWKELFVKRENFLVLAEKYIETNGPEALEKLIAKELNGRSSLEVQEKTEIHQTNTKVLNDAAQKDTKDTEDYQLEPNVGAKDNVFSVAEKKRMECKVQDGGEISDACASKKMQREWTCAICQLTTESEEVLNAHLGGKKHKAQCEALNKKNQPSPQKNNINDPDKNHSNKGSDKNVSTHAWKPKNTINDPDGMQAQKRDPQDWSEKESNEELAKTVLHYGMKQVVNDQMEKTIYEEKTINPQQVQGQKNTTEKAAGVKYPANCRLCNVRCNSESDMVAHKKGRKHKANVQILLLPKLIRRPNSSSGASV